MKASVFVTCLGDTFYPEAVRAMIRVLRRLGMEVQCPIDQTCCGQPLFNAGYFDLAKDVAEHFVDVFSNTHGPIVAPSSSCAAMVREHYPRLFKDEAVMLERVKALGARTFEFTEFLVRRLRVDLHKMNARFEGSATFHRSCHFRSLGLESEPVDLIRSIGGIEYIPLEKIEQCCGFGGTFSLNFPHVSLAMAGDKVRCIERTGAEWLVFADPGCAMNLMGYARRKGRKLNAMHIAQLVDRALGGTP